MAKTPDTDINGRYNRDEDVKAPAKEGQSPRSSTEPEGSEASARTSKTAADPQTGESTKPAAKTRP